MSNAAIQPTPQELSAFAPGKLADATSAAIVRHLEKCLACRQVIENRLPTPLWAMYFSPIRTFPPFQREPATPQKHASDRSIATSSRRI